MSKNIRRNKRDCEYHKTEQFKPTRTTVEQYQYLENSIWCIIDLVYVPRHEPWNFMAK